MSGLEIFGLIPVFCAVALLLMVVLSALMGWS